MFRLVCALLLICSPALAWEEPQRGSALRSDLMSAIRPHIEWALSPPIEFVIWELRVAGDVAFASVMAQRPGGGTIDVAQSPAARRGEIDASVGDGATVQALLQKSGNVWVATHHAIGATDAWWYWDEFCPIWHSVIPEACGN